MDSAKPREACSAKEMRKHGLRLIVGSVRHHDSPAISRFCQRMKIVVPRPPRRVLEVGPLLFRLLPNVNSSRVKLQPMLRGQFRDKYFVRIGSFAAQFVIEVHHTENDAQFPAQLQQQQQQRHGIRPARHRHSNAVARPHHFLFLQTGEEALPERARCDVSVCVLVLPTRHESPVTSWFFARILPRCKQLASR